MKSVNMTLNQHLLVKNELIDQVRYNIIVAVAVFKKV